MPFYQDENDAEIPDSHRTKKLALVETSVKRRQGFLDLPPELRYQIYELIGPPEDYGIRYHKRAPQDTYMRVDLGALVPSNFMLSSVQIRRELLGHYWSNTSTRTVAFRLRVKNSEVKRPSLAIRLSSAWAQSLMLSTADPWEFPSIFVHENEYRFGFRVAMNDDGNVSEPIVLASFHSARNLTKQEWKDTLAVATKDVQTSWRSRGGSGISIQDVRIAVGAINKAWEGMFSR